MTAPEQLEKAYDPREVESRWYPRWVEQGLFEGKDDPAHTREPFCIVIPPPNVTGSLHCGHALFATIQDIYTRQARMEGKNALWLPGVDHAGIATQVVVERLLKREGTDRHALGRTKFLERVWEWKARAGGTIDEQLKVLGSSADWKRHRFTMDEHMSRAVREAFVRLYEEQLIYRTERLVNWSVGGQTVLSDLEVEQNEEDGELFEFAYDVSDAPGEQIIVATTRPETMLGDTAVAVHPDDARYQHLIGKQLRHPFVDRRIPIIADSILVDPKFGTGAVKVTPAHDFNDFATGKRHQLPMVNIMNKDGTLNDNAGEFKGMERFAARKAVKKKLEELGFAKGSKKHRLAVPRCSRTNTVVEPLLSEQWYVKADVLAKPAIEAVTSGKTVIVPEEWTKTYMHWMTNIQDWCISRQLWWGHQIPAWYCADCKHITVARETPGACEVCKSKHLTQDEDVLDTWFSSGLWPFATLGWPDADAPALKTFYPTTIMETGFDILFFWVARMMMMGIHFMGEVPFKKIYLHGMVTDEKGDKMSKVKGNVIDPLDVIYGIGLDPLVAKIKDGGATDAALKAARTTYPEGIPAYGADALRWTLATYPPQQRKIPLAIKRIEGGRHLCNKLWNATRFALPMLDGIPQGDLETPPAPESLADRWILSRLSATAAAVQQGIDEFRLDEATSALYRFFWNELCDWYLELIKPILAPREGAIDESRARITRATLARVLEATLRLMHPFIPFVTEELWQKLPKRKSAASIVVSEWPRPEARDEAAEREMGALQAAISAVRTIRTEHGISPAQPVHVRLATGDDAVRALLGKQELALKTLARTDPLELLPAGSGRPPGFATSSAGEIEVQVLLKGLVKRAHETARLDRETKGVQRDIDVMEKKLSQPSFVEKAPAEVIAESRARLEELKTAKRRLEEGRALVDELDD